MQAPEGNNVPCELTAASPVGSNGVSYASSKQEASPSLVSLESCNQETMTGLSASIIPPYVKPKDDLELMLQHQDFSCLVALAVKVKRARQALFNRGYQEAPFQPRSCSAALAPTEVMDATERLQEQLVSKSSGDHRHVVVRGMYPITDSIMDDSLMTLQHELERCEQWLENYHSLPPQAQALMVAQAHPAPQGVPSSGRGVGALKTTTKTSKKRSRKKKEAIAVKYSKWQTDILMSWMIEHKDEPFPDPDEIQSLMQQTGLSQSQVVNWTTNVRKRNRKATCEGGKKPHHFIDFLFLAQDRENRDKTAESTPALPKAPHCPSSTFASACPPAQLAAATTSPLSNTKLPPLELLLDDDLLEPLSVVGDEGDDKELWQDFADFWLDDSSVKQTPGPLLPSVTDDSAENKSHPAKRARKMSVDLDRLSDEDIHSWAAELGLAIEI